jgi:hypothetical protein
MDAQKTIKFDWLENRYVDSENGECYKTLEDIPQQLRHLVIDKHIIDVPQKVLKKYMYT